MKYSMVFRILYICTISICFCKTSYERTRAGIPGQGHTERIAPFDAGVSNKYLSTFVTESYRNHTCNFYKEFLKSISFLL